MSVHFDFLRFGHMADPEAEATRFDFSFPSPGEFLMVGSRGDTVVYRSMMNIVRGIISVRRRAL